MPTLDRALARISVLLLTGLRTGISSIQSPIPPLHRKSLDRRSFVNLQTSTVARMPSAEDRPIPSIEPDV